MISKIVYGILTILVLFLFSLMFFYKMYFEILLIVGLIILFYLIYKFLIYIFVKYGIKKQGYICYYNDYSSSSLGYPYWHRGWGTGSYGYGPPQIDIIINEGGLEKKIYSKVYFNFKFIKKFNSLKFYELASSNKKMYVDVYFIGKKYYVDLDSMIIR